MKKKVVLGTGNELLRDEGVGVHAIRILQSELPPSRTDVEVVEVGTSPDIWHLVEGADKLVIVDAVKGGCEPGTIYRFDPDQITADTSVTASVHQLGLLENLKMMELMGGKPEETVIIGVEPADMGVGLELSEELRKRMARILQTVQAEIDLPLGTSQITNEARV